DSIISIASRSDNQMSFLLSTIDYIDEVNNVKMMYTLCGCYAKQVYVYSRSNMSTMIICVIRFCSVKEWKGI
ncbi:unnamed protein product, partial [Brassica napus]